MSDIAHYVDFGALMVPILDATTASGEYDKGMATFTVAKDGLMCVASVGDQKFGSQAKWPTAGRRQ